jgi:predicted amidohydrolase YtcJ
MNGKNASEIQTGARINARDPVHHNAPAKPPTSTKARRVNKNKPMVAQRKKRHML